MDPTELAIIISLIGLCGAIVGGIIGIAGQIVLAFFDYKKWKKEKKIESLRMKRDRLEKLIEETHKRLIDGMEKDFYSSDMISNFKFIFPENVFNAFDNLMKDKDQTVENKNKHFYFIMSAIKKSLSDIDEEIEKEIS